jgi:hypothetical protein
MRALNDFNRIFGDKVIFNVKLRQRALLMVIGLWRLEKKVAQNPEKFNIQTYMKKLAALDRLFNQCSNERRDYDDHSPRMPSDLGGSDDFRNQDRLVPAVRKPVHHHMASAE